VGVIKWILLSPHLTAQVLVWSPDEGGIGANMLSLSEAFRAALISGRMFFVDWGEEDNRSP
jgi:hypothetical protein